MAKDTLRSLSGRMPAPDVVDATMLHLHREDDRTVAIVGASLIESCLEQLLIASFKSKAADLHQRLFENRGPLSDFNSKILLAQAFAVITDRMADDIQRIRKIRNCFAHARIAVTFEDPAIAREVSDLAAVMAVRSTKHHYTTEESYPYGSQKVSYGLSCYITMTLLNQQLVEQGGERVIGR